MLHSASSPCFITTKPVPKTAPSKVAYFLVCQSIMDIPGTATTISLILRMVGIDKNYELNFLTERFRSIMKLCLFRVSIEGSPVLF